MPAATLRVGDMMCVGCEETLTRALEAIDGVRVTGADFASGTVRVDYDEPAALDAMRRAVAATGYALEGIDVDEGRAATARRRDFTVVYLLIIVVGVYVVLRQTGLGAVFNAFPTVGTETVGLAALFVVGLLTSVHCVAMCGGINLAQSVAARGDHPLRRAALYNAGRLTSYTLIGGLLGLLGEAVAITTQARAAVGAVAGVAMVAVGIGLAGRFSFMRALSPRLPAPVRRAAGWLAGKGAFAVGLANGLMPCGPLQAMQLYAIASGGLVAGASSLFFFCLGTVPLMFAFSGVAGALKAAWKRRMTQLSSAVIMLLGVVMAANSLSIVGVTLPTAVTYSESGAVVSRMRLDGTQTVTSQVHEDGYDSIQVQAGSTVVWTLSADDGALNGCNNAIVVPELGLEVDLQEGDTVVEFTPTETGTYTFSCWMGMLHGTIEVVE